VPAIVSVGFYFEKWRSLAMGIAVCGSGLGNFRKKNIENSILNFLSFLKGHSFLVQLIAF
jgi:hypothetical protein